MHGGACRIVGVQKRKKKEKAPLQTHQMKIGIGPEESAHNEMDCDIRT
jgi:hypothetical protein